MGRSIHLLYKITMAGLLNGVGGLVGDTAGSVTVPLLGQERGGNRNGNDGNQGVRPPRGGLLAPAPSSSGSPSSAPDRNSAADGPGLIQSSASNLLPTLPLGNGGGSRSTAAPTSIARTTQKGSSTAAPSTSATPTSAPSNTPTPPAPTPDPEPTSILPTSPPETTPLAPLPTTLETIATPLPTTSSVPNAGQGLGAPPLATPNAAQSQAGGFVMDPTKNPVMMALVIAVPIGLAVIAGITVLLFKKGCLGSGRRKGRVIQDEIEHEAWQKVHAQKGILD
ncbi:hypothetical protein MCOR04_007931 [Pyricularia oryzae]|nr:hypothetical protein MCOR30_009733 [Pyricularia oryzae]KAI6444481.1 hypothetical protein MCOR22_004801 [Pyricularia oryzae]KAI6539495.1 hypothetical protein MCOR05_004599 [Pyricularia oryzae]KAI6570973.1 hypothetical protein MCOR04_007931 [Pyricularia oryzae]